MGRDISIAISARDNYSSAITTMRNANQNFNKDLEGLISKLKELDRTKATVKADMEPLKKSLKDAQAQYKNTGSAADEFALKLANEKYENGRRNLDLLSKNARQAEKDILSLTDAVSRSDNRAGGIGGSKGGEEAGLASSLAKAGLGKMLGDSVSGLAKAGISSAFGDAAGNAISTTLSGAITGAAIGSIIPGIGTAIGAAVGAAAGGITAYTQNFEKEDDAFKTVVQSQIGNAQQKQDNDINAGVGIAGKRQMDKTAFTSFLGSESAADQYLKELRLMDMTNPFSYDDLTGLSRTLFTYRMGTDEIKGLLDSIGDAGAATGMSTEDMNMVAKTIGQLTQTATATRVDLNKMTDRGIPVIDYLAQDLGKTVQEVFDMISDPKDATITGKYAADVIREYMAADPKFKGMAEKQSQTYLGQVAVREGLEDNLKAAYGEGFMKERTKGLQAENAFLTGSEAELIEEANRRIGEYKAYLENEKERVLRDTLKNTVESEEYKQSLATADNESAPEEARIAARANMGRMLQEAQIKAEADYMVSEGATIELEAQKTIAGNVREILKKDEVYKKFGYEMGMEFTKGLASVQGDIVNALTPSENSIRGRSRETTSQSPTSSNPRSPYFGKAFGMPYIPYDDYVIRAHQGERLLTASEARAQDNNSNSSLPPISGNNFIIREEADIYKVAQALASELRKARMISN